MISSFSQLKKSAEDLNKKVAASLNEKGEKKVDDRFWYPSRGKDGNGMAIIRFLPASAGSESPYEKVHSYSFKGPSGKWYIENSLSTLGQKDPCAEENSRLWNSGLDSDKDIVRERRRKTTYYFNVYIIKDSVNPENEGTVRILRGGPMWFNFVKSQLVPEFEDQASVPVFDFWKGANLRVRVREERKIFGGKEQILPNYDASTWDSPSPLFDDDDKLKEIWEKQHDLKEFVAPENFKSYEDLQKRLREVTGMSASFGATNLERDVEAIEKQATQKAPKQEPTMEEQIPWKSDEKIDVKVSDDDDDFDMGMFSRLLQDD